MAKQREDKKIKGFGSEGCSQCSIFTIRKYITIGCGVSKAFFTNKYVMGPGGHVGRICCDNCRNRINSPDFFLPQLDIFETTLTRDKEIDNRVIIAHYLTHAVKLARKEFGLNRLVCSYEIEAPEEQIPDIGYLASTLDLVIATMTGKRRVGIWAFSVS
jgi:hypothetical protein